MVSVSCNVMTHLHSYAPSKLLSEQSEVNNFKNKGHETNKIENIYLKIQVRDDLVMEQKGKNTTKTQHRNYCKSMHVPINVKFLQNNIFPLSAF